MQLLITGGAGFIGSTLADALLARGDKVTVLDNFDPHYDPQIKWRNIAAAEDFKTYALVEGDIRDAGVVDDLLRRTEPDAIVHLAALAGVRESIAEPQRFNAVNVDGTLNLLEAARRFGQPRFVFASTSSVYGLSPTIPYREDDPLLACISPYGATKIAGEKYAYIYHQVHGLQAVSLRFFTAYGPRQRPDMAIHKFARAILDCTPLPVYGDGSTSRDYTYIDDVVAGVLAALDGSIPYGVYNLGGGTVLTLKALIGMLELALGCKAQIEWLPEQPGDPPHTSADISRAAADLGYDPQTTPTVGIPRFVEWLLASTR